MSSSGPVWAILALTWTTLGADLRNFPVWRGCAYVWVVRIHGLHAFCDRKDGAEEGGGNSVRALWRLMVRSIWIARMQGFQGFCGGRGGRGNFSWRLMAAKRQVSMGGRYARILILMPMGIGEISAYGGSGSGQ